MSGNLVPQKRMDKTGKLVTRHVLAEAPISSTAAPIPAPSVKAVVKTKKTTLKPPLPKQLKVQTRMTNVGRISPDPELLVALGIDPENAFPLVSVKASDVQLFDMFSVASTSNAAMLVSYGVKTPDDAVEFLKTRGIGHLVLDRREVMDRAQSLRVNAWNLMDAPYKFEVDELACDADRLIQAVRLDDSASLPRWKDDRAGRETKETSYANEVLNGSISYDDVMYLGLSFLADRGTLAMGICDHLRDIHEGRAGYDVNVLEHVLQKSRYNPYVFDGGMTMVKEYGADLVMELPTLDSALVIDREYPDRSTLQRADMIRYQRDGEFSFLDLSTKDIVELFDSGIPVDTAKEMLQKKLTVSQIIGVRKEGISQPVASGWL